jgi:subtilase family serine protease
MRRTRSAVAATAALAAMALLALPPAPSGQRAIRQQSARPVIQMVAAGSSGVPLTTSQCLAVLKVRCYSPLEYQAAYNVGPLYKRGITGKGETIAIVESFGSPTIAGDLKVFDGQWHLPDTTLTIFPEGRVPAFDPKSATMIGWAQETTLDVEYAHALAPGAAIDLIETPVAETEGLTGFPQMMAGERALIAQGKVDVISQSFGATEDTLPGFPGGSVRALASVRTAFDAAVASHVTMVAAAGDEGVTGPGPDGTKLYGHRAISWPASDPMVTAVGGTKLTLNNAGTRIAPDTVWDDTYGAGGGGQSAIFARPSFQSGVASVTGDHRGVPDISMSASMDGGAITYGSYQGAGGSWQVFGGTSEATPLFAAIVALADQMAGHRLGPINNALYGIGSEMDPAKTGIVHVAGGTNSYAGVAGFHVAPGYNLAVGWGTINAAVFVPALAHYAPKPKVPPASGPRAALPMAPPMHGPF